MKNFLIFSLIIFSILVCFSPIWEAEFLHWDDVENLVKNPHYRGFGGKNLKWMFTTTKNSHYHPFTWLSFAIDYKLWKLNPQGYHFTNLLLHIVNSFLFYQVILVIFFYLFPKKRNLSVLKLSALFGTLFFAIHPLRVESVAWVTERRGLLCAFFLLLSLLAYFCAQKKSQKRYFFLSLFLFLCALLSKTWAITFPAVLLFLDIYPLRRISFSSCKKALIEKIPYFLLTITFATIALKAASNLLLPMKTHSLTDRIIQVGYGLCFYIWKTIIPHNLAGYYNLPRSFLLSGNFCSVHLVL